MTFTVPVSPGPGAYTIRLGFLESYYAENNKRVFNVIVNGVIVVPALDVHALVGFRQPHVVEVDVDINDGESIIIALVSFGSFDFPMINVIELLQTVLANDAVTPGATTAATATTDDAATTTVEVPTPTGPTNPPTLTRVVGLNCGGHALTDAWGNAWVTDAAAASGGVVFDTGVFVDPELYEGDLLSTERYAGFGNSGVVFTIGGLSGPGRYRLKIAFLESYWQVRHS